MHAPPRLLVPTWWSCEAPAQCHHGCVLGIHDKFQNHLVYYTQCSQIHTRMLLHFYLTHEYVHPLKKHWHQYNMYINVYLYYTVLHMAFNPHPRSCSRSAHCHRTRRTGPRVSSNSRLSDLWLPCAGVMVSLLTTTRCSGRDTFLVGSVFCDYCMIFIRAPKYTVKLLVSTCPRVTS